VDGIFLKRLQQTMLQRKVKISLRKTPKQKTYLKKILLQIPRKTKIYPKKNHHRKMIRAKKKK
jgi:hypothetical protein